MPGRLLSWTVLRRLQALTSRERPMNFDNTDAVDGYAVPQDPMDLLQCDSCQ